MRTTGDSEQPDQPEDAWGKPISEERQSQMAALQAAWNAPGTDHGERRGPLDGVTLTGADVAQLATQSGYDEIGRRSNLHLEGADLSRAHLGGAYLSRAHLEGAILTDAHLEGADLSRAHLEGASLGGTYLEGADLSDARLERAFLRGVHLKEANLLGAHLEDAYLGNAHLEDAYLYNANLEGADLRDANLERANLLGAHLERAYLRRVNLKGAYLLGASLDKATALNDATLTGAVLDQTTFDATNLSVVDWRAVPYLGDELQALAASDPGGTRKARSTRRDEFRAAARAYRRLVVSLLANGLSDDAARYTYRAQICQRRAAFFDGRLPVWLGSCLLAAMAGYGYRLGRIFLAYLLIVSVFAAAFLAVGVLGSHATLSLSEGLDALQISLNAIHGRVFFAQFKLDSTQSWIATLESIVGIGVEGIFVAMLIQRLFSR